VRLRRLLRCWGRWSEVRRGGGAATPARLHTGDSAVRRPGRSAPRDRPAGVLPKSVIDSGVNEPFRLHAQADADDELSSQHSRVSSCLRGASCGLHSTKPPFVAPSSAPRRLEPLEVGAAKPRSPRLGSTTRRRPLHESLKVCGHSNRLKWHDSQRFAPYIDHAPNNPQDSGAIVNSSKRGIRVQAQHDLAARTRDAKKPLPRTTAKGRPRDGGTDGRGRDKQ
jgi:hypothetical protein